MISFTARMRFRPEDREEVMGFLRELTTASRAEPGCVSYIAHRVEAEPDTVLIYEQYRDEVALEEHRATAPFERFTASGPYQGMLDRKIERLVALG